MWQDFFFALALMLVFEGVMPFLTPESFRRALLMMVQMGDRGLRMIGLASMTAGIILLYLTRYMT
ncbi:MAG: DUF2065 domain-containing protein [Gammaproteobacteria bacterium]|nr:MAG: DUF2065 domain-containing protein [Gammaproteobacteria bacterium]